MYITYLEEWIEQERNRAQSQEQQLKEGLQKECNRATFTEQQLEERVQQLEELIRTMTDVAKDFGSMYAGKLEGVE